MPARKLAKRYTSRYEEVKREVCQSTRIANRLSLDHTTDIFLLYIGLCSRTIGWPTIGAHTYRLDQRLTRPWYFRLSTFERSCNSDLPRVPIASAWMIAFICLRANICDWSTAMPLKFYSFRNGRERIGAGILRTIIAWRNVTMEVIGRLMVIGSRNPYWTIKFKPHYDGP